MALLSVDNKVNLIINRMTKEMYSELCAIPGEMSKHLNELFLIEDENFDVYNKRIINVKQPEDLGDAVNLNWLETQYVQKDDILNLISSNVVYSYNVPKGLPNNSEYIDKDGYIYHKNVLTSDTSTWRIEVKKGSYRPENIQVKWRRDFGWTFYVKNTETVIGGRLDEPLADSFIFSDDSNYISASSWYIKDKVVRCSDVFSELSNISSSSTVELIGDAISKLCNKIKN